MKLPSDAKERKEAPIASGVLDYFPRAIAAVARLSVAGNRQHNGDAPLHWDRSKSRDHADCIARHLIDRGTIDTDGQRHSAKVAWRALAALELELEAAERSNEALPKRFIWQVECMLDFGKARREVPMAGGFMSPDEPGVIGN